MTLKKGLIAFVPHQGIIINDIIFHFISRLKADIMYALGPFFESL